MFDSLSFILYFDDIYFSKGGRVEIPCIVRNRQGSCNWLHNGSVIGPISGKYLYAREPNDGKFPLKSFYYDNNNGSIMMIINMVKYDSMLIK